MKRTILLLALFVSCKNEAPASSTTSSAVAPAQPASGAEATVARITPADLQKRLGSVTLIDVRHADNYSYAHIPGALHIPLSFVEQEAPYLPKGRPIVTYCT